jgi:hypothetical protein
MNKNSNLTIFCAFPDCENVVFQNEDNPINNFYCDVCESVTCVRHKVIHPNQSKATCDGMMNLN